MTLPGRSIAPVLPWMLLVVSCGLGAGRPVGPVADDAAAWVDSTLSSLDLEARVGQLFVASTPGRLLPEDAATTARLFGHVRSPGIGGVVVFQGTALEQAALVAELQREARVPLLVSQDVEWGVGMRVEDASRYPVAMAIAATGDDSLAWRAGFATGMEARALGVTQLLAPVGDLNGNPRNPVISTRAFSDRPDLASRFVSAFVRGAREAGTLPTVKHFPGHGPTSADSHETLPVVWDAPSRIDSLDLAPFRAARDAGVGAIMTAHVAYPGLGDPIDRPASLSRRISTDLLRGALGFEGLVVTDALNMDGVRGFGTPAEIAVAAVEAGADLLVMSTDLDSAHAAVVAAVRSGRIPERRIEDSVRRILTAKASLGLHSGTSFPVSDVPGSIRTGPQRALEQVIARRALTLLRGDLPFVSDRPGERVLVVALQDRREDAESMGFVQTLRTFLPDASVDVAALHARSSASERAAVVRSSRTYSAVVVAALHSASSWFGRPGTAAAAEDLVARLAEASPRASVVVFGTPYLAASLPAGVPVLLAWDRSPAMQDAAAQAMVGRLRVGGRLPISISAEFPAGAGRTAEAMAPSSAVPETVGLDGPTLELVEPLIREAIGRRAFPGAAVAVGRGDAVVTLRGFGRYTYDATSRPVTTASPFDLASVTKVVATTTALMLLVDRGQIDLDAPVARYVPEFGRKGKDRVTVRHLLTHTGGLIPFRPFHRMGITDRRRLLEAIFDEELQYEPGSDSRYSDFGPIVLAVAVERITGVPFDHFVRESVFEPLGMWHTGFRRAGRPDPAAVPTELDRDFRKRLVQGEVHDETAWILGGTAGHAGLFSTAEDLSRFAAMLASDGIVGGRPFVRSETLRLFTTRVDTTGRHTRALGWDTRAREGPSSAGSLFGPRSFGHTGFTGTSIWVDPDRGLWVILLANRVYPTRDNQRHAPVRSALADLVHGALRTPDAGPVLPGPRRGTAAGVGTVLE